jgi:hypothetical protein
VDPDGPASIWLPRIRIWNADPDPRETKLIKIRTKATTYQTKEVRYQQTKRITDLFLKGNVDVTK